MRVQRFILVLFLLALGSPAMASVSLGEIEVRSFLNQPLQAQIRAQGSALLDDGLELRLAPEEAYRRAGLSRGAVPADLDIQLEGTGTSRIVRLSTQRPVREPYVGLLLEVRWGAGRVLREYTILLDPPVAFAPERSVAPIITRAEAPAPRPAARVEPAAPRGGVHTVRPGDNLLAIVRRQGYTGVSMNQAMLAILEANPQAFADGNVNRLLAGARLNLPDQAEVFAIDAGMARQEIQRQTTAWRDGATPPPPTIPAEPAAPAPPAEPDPELPEGVEPEAEPEAAAPAEEVDPAVPVDERDDVAAAPLADDPELMATDRLEILVEREQVAGVTDGQGTQVIEEALLSQQTAMSELRDELISLRGEVAERDQLIGVMNSELAQLEQRLREIQAQPGAGPQSAGSGEDLALHQRIAADPLLSLLALTSILLFLLLLVSVFRPIRREAAVVERAPAPSSPAAEMPPAPPATPAAGGSAASAGAASAVAAGLAAGAAPKAGDDAHTEPQDAPVTTESRDDDLLADLDLYLAYGMNDQAISALENAIREGRDKPEYRVRLIEAYAANDNADAVHANAAALRERLGPGDDAMRQRIAAAEARVGVSGDASGTAAPVKGKTTREADEQTNSLDFEVFDAPEPEAAGDAARSGAAQAGEDDADLLRFDLDAIDGGEPAGAPSGPDKTEARKSSEPDGPDELPMLDLPDFDAPAEAGPTGDLSGFGGEADTSENGMKLSLAEAFVEMGDRDGALALLDEIMSSATPEQAAKAEAIRNQVEGGKG